MEQSQLISTELFCACFKVWTIITLPLDIFLPVSDQPGFPLSSSPSLSSLCISFFIIMEFNPPNSDVVHFVHHLLWDCQPACQSKLWPFYLGGFDWSFWAYPIKYGVTGIKSLWCLKSTSWKKHVHSGTPFAFQDSRLTMVMGTEKRRLQRNNEWNSKDIYRHHLKCTHSSHFKE